MTRRRFVQCDVFAARPTLGNGLAVVVDGEGLSDARMQGFAAWTNLAETTFLLEPVDARADYRVRIFTPAREIPFAGHPTLGSCAAWLATGGTPRDGGVVRQECGVGVVEIDLTGEVPAFVAPPTSIGPLPDEDLRRVLSALAIPPEAVVRSARLDNGPVWQVLELRGADEVLAVDASRVRYPAFRSIGLMGPHPEGAECDLEVRNLAPSSGMIEDPITGSLNAALACWMRSEGRLKPALTIAQGTSIGREGRVFVRADPSDGGRVLIGGRSHVVIEGTVEL